jgi:hypothetical protein
LSAGVFHKLQFGSILNLKQKIALGLGAVNLALLWLFPPFDSFSFADTKTPIFAGFHFRFARAVNEVINSDVLLLEIVVLLVNVGIAWLLLRDVKNPAGKKEHFNYQNTILLVMAVNLTVIILYLEVIFVLFNGSILWLLFNRVKERELSPQEAMELMRKLSGKQ